MIRLAVIAAIMATPLYAGFTMVPMASYCSSEFTDFEDKFGEFESVDFSKTNNVGFKSVFAENERYTLNGLATPDGNICVTFAIDRGEGV